MSRLINDDELKKSIHEKTLFSKWQKVLIETVIDDQPTVDAVPVVHGRWKCISVDRYVCSVCGCEPWYGGSIRTLNYCPYCGALMDAERKEHE